MLVCSQFSYVLAVCVREREREREGREGERGREGEKDRYDKIVPTPQDK